jgi:hypothetical protein
MGAKMIREVEISRTWPHPSMNQVVIEYCFRKYPTAQEIIDDLFQKELGI